MYIFFLNMLLYCKSCGAVCTPFFFSFFLFFNQYYKLHFTASVNLPVINVTVAFSVLS